MTAASDAKERMKSEARRFLDAAPDIKFVDAFLTDINGVLRGKRLPATSAMNLFETGLRLPRSLVGVDIWGADALENGLVLETGDGDGLCAPVGGGLTSVPWADTPTAQVLMMMGEPDGTPFLADPRQLLVDASRRCVERGLFPAAAFELEFYLLSRDTDELGRPLTPKADFSGRRNLDGRMYAMGELDGQAQFFADLYEACDRQGLPLDTAVVESGPGQFEINLQHQDDVVCAADHAVLLRRAIRGVAAKHDALATFMAKPFGALAGNGMHVHMSIKDKAGANLFDDGTDGGSDMLRRAVAGLIKTAPEAMIFFAPHLNSMRRFQYASHAPTRAAWGYENRTAAIRIPTDSGKNRRFEHRIAGADANPYLVMAALLAGTLHGIDGKLAPPAPVGGDAYDAEGPVLPNDWAGALDLFTRGAVLSSAFGELFTRVFAACKRQEIRVSSSRVTDFEYDTYLQAF